LPAPAPATNQNFLDAINAATASANAAADAVNLALARGLNPLSFLPSTTPNRNVTPTTITATDGTVITVTPPTTLGGPETVSPAPSSTTNTGSAPNTPPSPSTVAVSNLPTDYARQGEAATAATSITTAMTVQQAALVNAINGNGATAPPDDSALFAAENTKITDAIAAVAVADSASESMFNYLIAPDFGISTCSPFTKTIVGKTFSVDLCWAVNDISLIIGWLFALFTIYDIFGLMTRKA
jgi:hypothetical protein